MVIGEAGISPSSRRSAMVLSARASTLAAASLRDAQYHMTPDISGIAAIQRSSSFVSYLA
ncbi:protein of unknown function [Acidithiobacillus ferrivorans]|uniref:Uncharacterized protein n=1 Tax=Acidithiobacillus ferrivorans TaxID=160808 RepID=A0ABY1MN19_9PROT|nr:protein of unknown function [Acidithiobacillus ferrivorans]